MTSCTPTRLACIASMARSEWPSPGWVPDWALVSETSEVKTKIVTPG